MSSVPNASAIEVAGLELERITELQQLLSEALAVQTEQGRCLAEVRAELEAKKSELEAVRSRPVNGFTESRAEAETGSLQDRVTLSWQNKYEALAKLYSQLRTEHLDTLRAYKELQLKENAKTTAGEFVELRSWTPRTRTKQRQRQDRPRIGIPYREMSMTLLPSCATRYVRNNLICSQRAKSCNSRPVPRLQQVSSLMDAKNKSRDRDRIVPGSNHPIAK
jgi:hypothetical protein